MAVKTKDLNKNLTADGLINNPISAKGKTALYVSDITKEDVQNLKFSIVKTETENYLLIKTFDDSKGIKLSNYSSIKYIKTDKSGKKYKLTDIISDNFVDNTANVISTFNAKKFTATGTTKYNDKIDLYDSSYTAPDSGKNKNRGLAINGGDGNDEIIGTKYNDKITGGKGTNIINVYTQKAFGDDEIVLTKGENLIIRLADSDGVFGCYYAYQDGKNLKINIYKDYIVKVWNDETQRYDYNFPDTIQGTITIKNYFKKDVLTSSGSIVICNKEEDENYKITSNLKKEEFTTYMDSEHYKESSFTGSWVNDGVDATLYVAKDKKGNEITNYTEKTKGVKIDLGNAVNRNDFKGSKYADTVKGGKQEDYIIASKGNDTYTLGKGEDYVRYSKTDFDTDTINLTKGEDLTIHLTDFGFTTKEEFLNNASIKASGKNLIITIKKDDETNYGKIVLKNFAKSDVVGKNGKVKVLLQYETSAGAGDELSVDLKTAIVEAASGTWHNDLIDKSGYVNKKKKGLTINAKGGTDTIIGSKYSDIIKAGTGTNDIITGGTGNDKLYASTSKGSNTTFVFKAGDGKDIVYGGKGKDTLKFISGDLKFTKKKQDLVIGYNHNEKGKALDSVTIKNYYNKKGKATSSIKYIDIAGHIYNIEELKQGSKYTNLISNGNSLLKGTDNNDILISTATDSHSVIAGKGNDIIYASNNAPCTIDCGEGDDTIYGGNLATPSTSTYRLDSGANTVYCGESGYTHIYMGSGSDTVHMKNDIYLYVTGNGLYNQGIVESGHDVLYCDDNIGAKSMHLYQTEYDDLNLVKKDDDLILMYGENSSVTLKDYYTNENFSNVRVDSLNEARNNAIKKTVGQLVTDKGIKNLINGTTNADTITGTEGNDLIKPLSGDDEINLGIGNDVVLAGSGSKTITAVSGNNLINLGADNNTVYAGAGSDTIKSGAGTNTIEFSNSDNVADTYFYGNGNDTIIFKKYELSDIKADRSGDNIVIKNGDNDVLTIKKCDIAQNSITIKDKENYTSSINNLNTVLGLSTISNAQTLITGSGNDTVSVGLGNDIINVGSGNNTINLITADLGNNNTYTYTANAVDTFILPNTITDFNGFNIVQDGDDFIVGYNGSIQSNTVTISDYNSETMGNNIKFKIGDTTKTIAELLESPGYIETTYGTENVDNIDVSGNSKGTRILALEGNDVITGSSHDDYINGGAGADIMSGGAGNDTYIIDSSDWTGWQDVIEDSLGVDTLQINTTFDNIGFFFDVTQNNVVTNGNVGYSTGNDLHINSNRTFGFENAKTSNGVKINNYFTENGKIENIVIPSGNNFVSAINDNIISIVAQNVANWLKANGYTSTTDAIEQGKQAELMRFYKPIISYEAKVNGTANSELIIAQPLESGTQDIFGGDGDDIIYGSSSTYHYDGGTGNNTFYFTEAPTRYYPLLYLGSGDEVIYGNESGSKSSIYVHYRSTDVGQEKGNNTFYYRGVATSLVCYKKGMYEGSVFTRTDNDLTYRYGDTSITFKDYYSLSTSEQNSFYFNIYNNKNKVLSPTFNKFIEDNGLAEYKDLTGTMANEYVKGTANNDVITSGGGDDVLVGGAGNDEYHAFVGDNTFIFDKEGNDTLIFSNTTTEGNLLDNNNQKQIHILFDISKQDTAADFKSDVIFVDNDNLDLWKAGSDYKGLTVVENTVETIKSSDNYQITNESIKELVGSVASWLKTYKGGAYSNVNDVLSSNNDTDIKALVAQFDTANWQYIS